MAQIKLLKIDTDGIPVEMDTAADDITLNSFTVQGGGPVLSGTGLDMNGQNVSDAGELAFTDPTTDGIQTTAGLLIADDIMGTDRSNEMQGGSDILFGAVADVAGELDAFQIPQASAMPTATPAANANGGFLVEYAGDLYMWDDVNSEWKNLGLASDANTVVSEFVADEALAARDLVYISAADNVSKADVSGGGQPSRTIGFATAAVSDTDPVNIQTDGILGGFSGLTPGGLVWADPSTPGGVTQTRPSGAGNTIIIAGVAKSATEVFIDVQFLARLAA